MTNQPSATSPLTPARTGPDNLRQLLEKYKPAFERVLRDRAPQFASSLLQLVNTSKQLKSCEPGSVIAAAMTAATLDLPIEKNLGFAHIVPYGGLAQFQMGYKGFIQLSLRTGQYKQMNAKAVNAEAFGGYDDVGDPIIKWDKLDETKPEVGYVFAWKMTTGFTKVVYWTKEKVVDHAKKFSQAYRAGKKDSPWFTNFRAMGLKTVVKDGLSHWGIMSVQLQQAITEDQGAHKAPEVVIEYPDNLHGSDDDDGPPKMSLPEPAAPKAKQSQAPAAPETATPAAPTEETPPEIEAPILNPFELGEKLIEQIMALRDADKIKDDQILAYAKANKQAGQRVEQWQQMSNSKLETLIKNWPHWIDNIRKHEAEAENEQNWGQ